jgi:hypothetical protein
MTSQNMFCLEEGVAQVKNVELEAMALKMPKIDGHPNRLPFRGVLTLVGVASRRAPSGASRHRVMLTRKATEAALPSLLGMALDYAPALNAHDQRRKIGVITEAEIVPLSVSRPVANGGRQGWGTQAQGLKPESKRELSARLKSCPDAKPSAKQVFQQRLKSCPDTKHSDEEFRPTSLEHCQVKASETSDFRYYAGGQVLVSGFLYAHDFADVVKELRAGSGMLGMSYEITDAMVVSPASPIWTITAFTFTGAAVLRKQSAAYPETWIEISH